MKRKILFLILGLLSFTVNGATTTPAFRVSKPFGGFYGSLGLGYGASSTTNTETIMADIPFAFTTNFYSRSGSSDNSFNGGLFGIGYNGIVKQNFLIGIEGRFNLSNLSLYADSINTEVNTSLNSTSSLSIKLNREFSALLKLGYIFQENSLFYVILGPSWGDFAISSADTYTQNLAL